MKLDTIADQPALRFAHAYYVKQNDIPSDIPWHQVVGLPDYGPVTAAYLNGIKFGAENKEEIKFVKTNP